MLRRRRPAGRAAGAGAVDSRRQLDTLRAEGWILPGSAGGAPPRWTLVGTVDSPWATAVDPSGLITPFGPGGAWSLDWWIGADDRWHFPSTDSGVRQHLIGHAPVVETLVRIPGGDAVQRVYGMRGEEFAGGDEWVIIEVENRSSVPFAIAFAIRPATPEGMAPVSSIAMRQTDGGQSRDPAQSVLVDGRPGLVLARRPARIATSTGVGGDVAAIVGRGAAAEVSGAEEWPGVACAEGLAQAAFVFPVAHTATLRVALPMGAEPDAAPRWPAVIPPVAHVVSGWEAHAGRAVRMELPAPQLSDALAAARRSILLAPWSNGLRTAGPVRSGAGPGDDGGGDLADTGQIVTTLDRLGHHDEAGRTLGEWAVVLPSVGDAPAPAADAAILEAIAAHRLLTSDDALFDQLLPDAVAAVSRLDRVGSRGRLSSSERLAAVRALATMAAALDAVGQPDGAAGVRAAVQRIGARPEPEPAADLDTPRAALAAARRAIAGGDPGGVALLEGVVSGASPTWGFASAGQPQDLVAASRLIDAVLTLLVHVRGAGLDVLPVFPAHWYGGGVELHEAPTAHGRFSYAVRWHGTRPALLWELEPAGASARAASGPVRIAAPALDPNWSSTELRGDALLDEVAPPAGLDPVRVVVEHPDEGGSFA